VLDVLVAGSLDQSGGRVVLAHHGTPSTATFWHDWAEPLRAEGFSLVAYSRPGYTGSTRRVGRRVADAATDAVALMDALGVTVAAQLGYSGGCPHALAVGALAPERCSRVVTVAGVVPFDAEGVDFTDGMGAENVDEFGAAAAGLRAVEEWLDEFGRPMLAASADEIGAAFGDLVDDTDREVLAHGWAEEVAAEFHRVEQGGIGGWADDDIAFVTPWGFDPADVTVPVVLWHAGLDRMAPVSHSRWLAGRLPDVDYREVDGLGHLALLRQYRPEIIGSLEG
jgi:pimeloyl-ACP methyl ester carboxylesterase